MADARQIREGIKANLDLIPGCQISAYALSSPTLPCLYVLTGPAEIVMFDIAMARGGDEWTWRVVAVTGLISDIGSQMLMDEFLSPDGDRSVKAAVESDKTLGGLVDDVHVTHATGYTQLLREGAGPVLVVEFHVRVIT